MSYLRSPVCRLVLMLALILAYAAVPAPAHADTLTVFTAADGGIGSLRWAVANAASGDTITFLSGLAGSTITLTSGEIVIDKDLTINGMGANDLTVSGDGNSRVFNITAGASVNINGMTITDGVAGGSTPQGGGIRNAGTLTLTDCVMTNNSVPSGAGSRNGGAVINAAGSAGKATLTIERCTIENNSSAGEGGGVGNVTYSSDSVAELIVRDSTIANNNAGYGGGVAVYAQSGGAADATFINTTVSANDASADGGGFDLDVLGSGTMARVTIINTTVYSNTAGDGGGINVLKDESTLVLRNSIVAGNTASGAGADIRQGNDDVDIVFYGGNLIGTDAGIGLYSSHSSDQIGTSGTPIDPLLSPLTDNGGPTQTHIPQTSSPAIDAGIDSTCASTDQRGESRPADGDSDSTAACDSGAVEVQSSDLTAVIRCNLQQGQTVSFAASGVSADIVSKGSLSCLEVSLIPNDHPQATGGSDGEALRTGRYWTITETATTNDWEVNLSLLHNAVANPEACKYPGTLGGAGWDCDADSSTPTYVTRFGVTSFSDWAVGSNVSPTTVLLKRAFAASQAEVRLPAGWLVLGAIMAGGIVLWQRRRR